MGNGESRRRVSFQRPLGQGRPRTAPDDDRARRTRCADRGRRRQRPQVERQAASADLHRTEPARKGSDEPERAREGDHPERRTASPKAAAAFKNADGRTTSSVVIDGDREVMKDRYKFVNSVAVTLKAGKLSFLARIPGLTVTPDSAVRLSALPSSKHIWPTASGVRPLWSIAYRTAPKAPTIAIVDSGIDANRPDFDYGARSSAQRGHHRAASRTRRVTAAATARSWPGIAAGPLPTTRARRRPRTS